MFDVHDSDFRRLLVSFEGDMMTAQVMAEELTDFLRVETPGAEVTRHRDDPLAMDFGATLVIVLGSSSVTALATGLAVWLRRRQDARIQLRRTEADGSTTELTLDGQPSARTERIISDFLDQPR
jgi:hypothetical protein